MKKVIRYRFASGWLLEREYEDDADITSPLRDPEDLNRIETSPVLGRDLAVFLPRERVVGFDVGLASEFRGT